MADTGIDSTRVCTKCGIEKPILEYAENRKPKSERFRYRPSCKECDRSHKAAYMARYYAERRDGWNDKAKAWRSENPEEYRAKERDRGLKRKEQAKAYKKARWAAMTAEDRAVQRQRVEQWKEARPDKARAIEARRLERISRDPKLRRNAADRMARWRADNPESAAASRDRRRAREVGAEGHYTKSDVARLLKSQGRFCFYCSSALKKFECDHFIPLSRGGTNWPSNLRLSCPSCNYSKGAKMPWEWKPDMFSPP